ncbi:MAG TPA: addiction module antidote protein [Devosia sp.]
MSPGSTKWDVADYLESDEDIAYFLDAAFDDGDPAVIMAALGAIGRAKGMTQLAKDTGLAREALYRSLSAEGKPEFTTVLKVMNAFGLRLAAVPLDDKAA